MPNLNEALAKTNGEQALALRWFRDHTGQTVAWSDIQAHAEKGARLVTQAKGIYKPQYMEYALSVRQTLDSPYADKEVQRRPDGAGSIPIFKKTKIPSNATRKRRIAD